MFIRTDMFIYIVASLVTWLLTGLWHGAGYTFMVWGLLQCIFPGRLPLADKTCKEDCIKDLEYHKRTIQSPFWVGLLTFLAVMISWVIFRAENLKDAGYIIAHMFTGWSSMPYLGPSAFETVLGLALIVLLFIIQIFQYRGIASVHMAPSSVPRALRWAGYAMLLIMIAMFGVSSGQFIYFQF